MAIQLALKTLAAIDSSMVADQGAAFRVGSGKILPHMTDAYRGADEGFRSHLGASQIGNDCARQIWYGFRWVQKAKFPAQILRLFNRGHLEEARFLAMLLSIGCEVFQQDEKGNQFRISELGGHFGGAGDGVALHIPDIPAGLPCLLEFKTHGEKSFLKLQKEGVQVSKFVHYVQMQTYMRKMNITHGLYAAVNKNTDEIYMEIVLLNTYVADQFIERGKAIVMMRTAPDRIASASPGLFTCKYCDMKGICFNNEPMEFNCRTCIYSQAIEDGTWVCNAPVNRLNKEFNPILSKGEQLAGCPNHHTI
jgi:hypothetical protein